MFVALSSFNPAYSFSIYLSYTHLSILGLTAVTALFFFSLVCPHLAFFFTKSSSFIVLTWPYHISRFLYFYWTLAPLIVTRDIHLSILISFTSIVVLISSRCCPGLCAIHQSWSDHSFVNLSIQFHWHPPVPQQSTASRYTGWIWVAKTGYP